MTAKVKDESFVPVEGIRLTKEGRYTVVSAEIGGAWVEVIRELSDNQFDHIVNPSGIYARYYTMPSDAQLARYHGDIDGDGELA